MLSLLLLVSFLGTCGTVFYILYKHRHDRKSSISLHVAEDRRSHAVFALGHLVGGLAFLIFTYKFFYIENRSSVILYMASAGFFVEQIQAFLPNNERFKKIHTIAAFSMAVFMIIILAYAPTLIILDASWLTAYIFLACIYVTAGVYAYINKQKFYQTQLVFFSVFYLFLFILLYGRN